MHYFNLTHNILCTNKEVIIMITAVNAYKQLLSYSIRLQKLKGEIANIPSHFKPVEDFKRAFKNAFPDLTSLPLDMMTATSTQPDSNKMTDFKLLLQALTKKNVQMQDSIQILVNEGDLSIEVATVTAKLEEIDRRILENTMNKSTLAKNCGNLTAAIKELDDYGKKFGIIVNNGTQEAYENARDRPENAWYRRNSGYKELNEAFIKYAKLGGTAPDGDRESIELLNTEIEAVGSVLAALVSQRQELHKSHQGFLIKVRELETLRLSLRSDAQMHQEICDTFFQCLTTSASSTYFARQLESDTPSDLLLEAARLARTHQLISAAKRLSNEVGLSLEHIQDSLNKYSKVKSSSDELVDFKSEALEAAISKIEKQVADINTQLQLIKENHQKYRDNPELLKKGEPLSAAVASTSCDDSSGFNLILWYLLLNADDNNGTSIGTITDGTSTAAVSSLTDQWASAGEQIGADLLACIANIPSPTVIDSAGHLVTLPLEDLGSPCSQIGSGGGGGGSGDWGGGGSGDWGGGGSGDWGGGGGYVTSDPIYDLTGQPTNRLFLRRDI